MAPLFKANLVGHFFWNHVLADKWVGLLAIARGACSGPLRLSQACYGLQKTASGLFKATDSPRLAAVCARERRHLSGEVVDDSSEFGPSLVVWCVSRRLRRHRAA